MGIRAAGSSSPSQIAEKVIEMEKLPLKQLEVRKKKIQDEQKVFKELSTLVNGLNSSIGQLKSKKDFYKLKLESSSPDIIDGSVTIDAPVGSYEVEVQQLAKSHKLLTKSFPDKDKTSLGFGYLRLELDDGSSVDIDIDPSKSTLQEVSQQINDASKDIKAYVLKTKENIELDGEDGYRLLVFSEKTGKQAKIFIDNDMLYSDFHEKVTAKNLKILFEDVPIYDETNSVKDILPGMSLTAKRSEPGLKVEIKVDYDVDKTFESIKTFVENYNKFNDFIEKQFQVDPETQRAGPLAYDNTLRTLKNSLRGPLQGQHYHKILGDFGVTTDPKNGNLKLDEAKIKKALSDDYVGVARFFIETREHSGLGNELQKTLKSITDLSSGPIASRDRQFKRQITEVDKSYDQQQRFFDQKSASIKRRFTQLEQFLGQMNNQSQVMQAKLGGGAPQDPSGS